MKTALKTILVACIAYVISSPSAKAIVGYVNRQFSPGYSLFVNPLQYTNDHLSAVIATAPIGTVVSLWDYGTQSYVPSATFNGASWSSDFLLEVGTGAMLYTPAVFTNTFIGTLLNTDGTPWDGGALHLPPAAPPLTGLVLANSTIPASVTSLGGYTLFEQIFGRLPLDGEQFFRWNSATQTLEDPLFAEGGVWYDSAYNQIDPILSVGEAGFWGVGTPVVPEPTSMGLFALGAVTWFGARRRFNR